MKTKLHWRTLKACVEQGMTDPEIAEKYHCSLTEEAAKERDSLGYQNRPIPITWREIE